MCRDPLEERVNRLREVLLQHEVDEAVAHLEPRLSDLPDDVLQILMATAMRRAEKRSAVVPLSRLAWVQ